MNFMFLGEVIDYDFLCPNSKIKDLEIDAIIFLHGWGGNKHSFYSTINLLKNKFNILTISMPTIQPTTMAWTLWDYVNLIYSLCKAHNLKKVYIVCHSFGFRVACLLKQKIDVKKIVVTGGAGLKKFSILKKIKTDNNKILLRQAKFNYLYDTVASTDYKSLSKTNKKTFNAVVSIAFNKCCRFDCPMLLFWGKHDKETALWMARKIKQENHAQLIITKSNHFAYLDKNALFNNEVVKFLC